MATKPKEQSTEVVSLQEQIAAQLALQQQAAQGMRTTGSYIGFKNAQLKVDGINIPANQIDVRVLATVGERAYYAEAFDADKIQIPACYALNDTVPHPEAADPQSDSCSSCPHNVFGSAKQGRGKACREGARVIVVPSNVPLASAQMYTAKVPVSSLAAVTGFASRCSQAGKLSGEFVTKLSVVEDKKSFFKVHLTLVEATNDMDMALLMQKQTEAFNLAMQPYPVLD